jgi:Fe2+ or Zn2+ uptake regulation protein
MTSARDSEVDEKIGSLLSEMDYRYTSVHRRLVNVLRTSGKPLSNSQIVDLDCSLAQSSVYRNLRVLEEVGAVTRIVANDEFARYELAEHLTEHHHHIICSHCGDITDFMLPISVEHELEIALSKAGKNIKFKIDSHRLDAFGTCNSCKI